VDEKYWFYLFCLKIKYKAFNFRFFSYFLGYVIRITWFLSWFLFVIRVWYESKYQPGPDNSSGFPYLLWDFMFYSEIYK